MLPAHHVLDDTQRHANARKSESVMPVDLLPEVAATERRHESPKIDAHVKNRKTGVASHIAGRIKLAHHGADVWLEQGRAGDNQAQTEVEGLEGGNSQAIVTACDDDSAV